MRKRKLRNTRPKALFGEVAAAGITAAATLAAAGIGAAATAKAAKEQSTATIENAKQQAAAIEQTNQNNNQLQQQSQQFIAQENEANRQIQRDLQMNLQLQGGALDSEQRRAASRIQVKKGGKVKSRKKLRDAFFYGGGNLPFRVIDGGGVLPLGQTPEGYDLYEIVGNDHNHYHKTKGGKYKSGVGIEFDIPDYTINRAIQAKGGKATKVVEGEGNQNTEQGELLLMTPDSGMFISKHRNKGFNPAEAVMEGMHPLTAYSIQERLKGSSPVKGNRYAALAGVSTNYILPTDYPINDLGFDMSGVNVAAARRQLKKGGRCKAELGDSYAWYKYPRFTFNGYTGFGKPFLSGSPTYNLRMPLDPSNLRPTNNGLSINPTLNSIPTNSGNTSSNNYRRPRNWSISGNLIGAGLSTLGNLGGAWLTSWGAAKANKYLQNAYSEVGATLADAYNNLKTIDMSSINRDMFRNQHYMPVVRSTYFNVNPQLEDTNREFRRLMRATNANTLSSAARFNRLAAGSDYASQKKSQIYAYKANREEATKQDINKQINEAAAKNAELDVQSSRDFTGHYIDLLKYNNDIANERITGAAQAKADALMGAAGSNATTAQTIGQSWGNAAAASGQAFGNALATDAKYRAELEMARIGASRRGELSYLKRLGSADEINAEVNRLYSMLNNPNLSEQAKNEIQTELAYLTSDLYENSRNINNFNISMSKLGRMRGLATR